MYRYQIKRIISYVYKNHGSLEIFWDSFSFNIHSLIKIKKEFSFKFWEIQANMADKKLEDDRFVFDDFYEYEDQGT